MSKVTSIILDTMQKGRLIVSARKLGKESYARLGEIYEEGFDRVGECVLQPGASPQLSASWVRAGSEIERLREKSPANEKEILRRYESFFKEALQLSGAMISGAAGQSVQAVSMISQISTLVPWSIFSNSPPPVDKIILKERRDAVTGAVMPYQELRDIVALDISNDKKKMAVGTSLGYLYILERDSGNVLGRAVLKRDEISSLVFSRDGDMVAIGSTEGDIYIHDGNSALCRGVRKIFDGRISALAFSDDGKKISAESFGSRRVLDPQEIIGSWKNLSSPARTSTQSAWPAGISILPAKFDFQMTKVPDKGLRVEFNPKGKSFLEIGRLINEESRKLWGEDAIDKRLLQESFLPGINAASGEKIVLFPLLEGSNFKTHGEQKSYVESKGMKMANPAWLVIAAGFCRLLGGDVEKTGWLKVCASRPGDFGDYCFAAKGFDRISYGNHGAENFFAAASPKD